MTSKSSKQHRLMEAVAHNPKFAKKVGIDQKVGREFVAADKRGGKFKKGENPANRMDPAIFKGADGTMMMTHDALKDAMKYMASKGRDGDTELVHVNKAEEEMLKAHGGRGSVNPSTGLKEYPPNAADSRSVGMGVSGRDSQGNQTGRGRMGEGGGNRGTASTNARSGAVTRNPIAGAEAAIGKMTEAQLAKDIEEGKYKSSGWGKVIGGTVGTMSPLGPIGGLLGGFIGNLIDKTINAPPTPADAQQSELERLGFRQERDKFSGKGKVGNQGGGREGTQVPFAKSGAATPAIPGVPPATGTTTGTETKDYIDMLLERFKFPYFDQPVKQTIKTEPHEELIQSVMGNR